MANAREHRGQVSISPGGRIVLRSLDPDDDVTELMPDKAYRMVWISPFPIVLNLRR